MSGPEEDLRLDEAALVIAAHANPSLDVAAQLRRLDDLAGQVEGADMAALGRLLFERLGLRGDRENYDDPANSYLDRVLDRRLGIPITLSVLLIEVGRRRGLRLEGVGMPGHFLVRDPATPQVLIDAFDRGRRLDRSDCERLLQAVTGRHVALSSDMLSAVTNRAILARMLANLDGSFSRREDRKALSWVCDLRLAIPDLPVGDQLQLAGRLGGLGRFDQAADLLDHAARRRLPDDIIARLRAQAANLRARLN